MLYKPQREKLLSVLEDLKTYRLIDPSGGDLSLRCSDEHIIISPTGAAFRRWHIASEDWVVLDLKGNVIERGQYLGPGETPVALALYNLFPECHAYIHSHTKYSLAFASVGMSIPSTTNLMDTLGEIPCLRADDRVIKQSIKEQAPINIPPGMVQRPDVAAIFLFHIIPQIKESMLPRRDELHKHGLAFTVYKHGVFVFAHSIDEAFENLMRVETSACNYILTNFIQSFSGI